jgi:outer membrane lipoprotein-sorting protein
MLAALVVGMVLHAADPNEAEQLFRKMEMKLNNAKSVESQIDVKIEDPKFPVTIEGSLLLGEGNKARLEIAANFGGQKSKSTVISDGAKMVTIGDKAEKKPTDTPKQFNEAFKAMMTRTGMGVGLFMLGDPDKQKEFKIDDEMKVADFKLGKKEKVGDAEAQIIEYSLVAKNYMKEPLMVSVWVDTKTNLPLKRVVIMMNEKKEKNTVTETYSKLTVDEKVDAKKFELPKD